MNSCKKPKSSKNASDRCGSVLVAVLACMVVTIVLMAGAMKSTMGSRRACKTEHQVLQARQLLAAGLQRIKADGSLAILSQQPEQTLTWNAQPVMPEYAIAEVIFKQNMSIDNQVTELVCTARLAISDHREAIIQISQSLPWSTVGDQAASGQEANGRTQSPM